jgi:mRNA interferase RelE/StbE
MRYRIEYAKSAIKDLCGIERLDALRITEKVEALADDLNGDVKRLANFTPEYRLRVGRLRVLFHIEGELIIIHIRKREDVYRSKG